MTAIGATATSTLDNISKPNGRCIGAVSKGATPNIRAVSSSDFITLKNDLLDGATAPRTYFGGRAYHMIFQVEACQCSSNRTFRGDLECRYSELSKGLQGASAMNHEPVDKYFGTPMSDWIARVPNELDVDAVGLWQIIPVGIDSFGLSGECLDDFTRRCIIALLQRGAVPVRDPSGSSAMEYKGTYRDIADQIINQWKAGRPVADHNGLWFALVP